jgi:hypothetical protein
MSNRSRRLEKNSFVTSKMAPHFVMDPFFSEAVHPRSKVTEKATEQWFSLLICLQMFSRDWERVKRSEFRDAVDVSIAPA